MLGQRFKTSAIRFLWSWSLGKLKVWLIGLERNGIGAGRQDSKITFGYSKMARERAPRAMISPTMETSDRIRCGVPGHIQLDRIFPELVPCHWTISEESQLPNSRGFIAFAYGLFNPCHSPIIELPCSRDSNGLERRGCFVPDSRSSPWIPPNRVQRGKSISITMGQTKRGRDVDRKYR